ncbi:MAG: SIS domain-containing protein [Actinomycetota bacterium]|nr:SIS domain-containing protein [Actinomycetota bacterium]
MSQPALDTDHLGALLTRRTAANRVFFAAEADRLARVCHQMAERFARGGRLVAVGRCAAARSDARHIAVEFVHPVIVGKRALPALALTADGGPLDAQVALLARPDDIAVAFGTEDGDPETIAAVHAARQLGALTIAFGERSQAEHIFVAPGTDADVTQELVETLYHVLWELVHVFFDHQGLLAGRAPRRSHDAGASGFLYPFLDQREDHLQPILADVARSVLAKSEETSELRAQTIGENRAALHAAAAALQSCFANGGQLLAFGNGGSATDAMDAVADFRSAACGRQARPALDLTEDPAILTAIANDVGTEPVFLRQVIAYGRAGDALLALSTSGNSANIVAALREGRRRGMTSIAMVGYDGGQIASEGLADHVIITRSEHIPRIQEAQATAYHALRELVG